MSVGKERIKGTVVFWHKSRGFGFIRNEEKTDDYFVHYKDVEFNTPRKILKGGKEVSFILEDTRKGSRAREVKEEEKNVGSKNFKEIL